MSHLFILPFDHRHSFTRDILGISDDISEEQREEVKELKKIIYQGFLSVWEVSAYKEELGILVDTTFGSDILHDAKSKIIITAVPIEKSGRAIFEPEIENWQEQVVALDPTYVKVLVRYNPANTEENKKQLEALKKVSVWCVEQKRKLLFELLVPPSESQKNNASYDAKVRPLLTKQAIEEISTCVHADIWKLEGMEQDAWEAVLSVVAEDAKVIVLGRGEDTTKVEGWIQKAKTSEKIIGFAIGRTIFYEAIVAYHAKKISKEQCSTVIAEKLTHFIALWKSI